MRRQMIDRAAAGQDRLEAARRYAVSGGPAAGAASSIAGGSPMATPRDRTQAGYAGSTAGGVVETAAGYAASEAGAGEEYQYQPTKVGRYVV
jgi:hypothetical protein